MRQRTRACMHALARCRAQDPDVPRAVEGAEVGYARQPAAAENRSAPGYVVHAAVRTVQVRPRETGKHLGVWLGQAALACRSLQAKRCDAVPGSSTLGAERVPVRDTSTAVNTSNMLISAVDWPRSRRTSKYVFLSESLKFVFFF